MEMIDFRGNKYDPEDLVCKKGKPIKCESCHKKPAVRNFCKAEGDIGRTHWHGAVHTDEGLVGLCRDCSIRIQGC